MCVFVLLNYMHIKKIYHKKNIHMKKIYMNNPSLLAFVLTLALLNASPSFSYAGSQQEENPYNFTFYGFVNYEMSYDTRQVVAAREGNVLLYPAPKKLDADGKDINAQPSLAYYVLTSRIGGRISGPEILGASSSAVVEGDILGTSADKFHQLRLRHAFIRFNWENSELIAGQYWHPLFLPFCFPHVVNFGGSVPYHVLHRAPQLRFTHHIGQLSVSATMATHGDFPASGPAGPSSTYLRNSGVPEMYLQSVYATPLVDVGASVGYMTLKPRLETQLGYKTTETMGSLSGHAFLKLKLPAAEFKVQGIYGENMTHLIMLGGYGETDYIDEDKGIRGYTGVRTRSLWAEVETTGTRYRFGFHAAYAENMGAEKEITGQSWVRGGDIEYIYRLAPRARIVYDKFSINFELVYDVAAYGTPDNKFTFDSSEEISNIRAIVGMKYDF